MDAVCLFSLADLALANTEPPLTMDLSQEELEALVEEPLFVDLPCHTVAVERGVKDTTGAALKSANPKHRDGISFQIADSRGKNKMTKTKKKFWKV